MLLRSSKQERGREREGEKTTDYLVGAAGHRDEWSALAREQTGIHGRFVPWTLLPTIAFWWPLTAPLTLAAAPAHRRRCTSSPFVAGSTRYTAHYSMYFHQHNRWRDKLNGQSASHRQKDSCHAIVQTKEQVLVSNLHSQKGITNTVLWRASS